MSINYLAFGVPLFLLLMALEYGIALAKKKDYFRFDDSIANLSVGIAERLMDAFVVGAFYFFYAYLHRHFAILDIRPSVLLWLALFIATDFAWYWYHRLAHEVNLLWSVHVVHHQSEHFNYTVSARITVFQAVARTGFWAVLPIIGFPPEMITTVLLVHGTYPFFIHTRLVGKLGLLEYIFVTPSHHRVHHGSNEQYLDKNYGDVLIIWDKLFGTFTEEQEEPRYGLTKPLNSHSFLWQHFHSPLEIFYAASRVRGWKNKLAIVFGRPETVPAEVRATLEQRFLPQNEPVFPATRRFRNYVVWQIGAALVVLFGFLLFEAHLPLFAQVGIALLIILTLINCGAILERRTWVFRLEYTRVLVALWLLYGYVGTPYVLLAAGVLCLLAVCFFTRLRREYLKLVYA